MRLSDGVEWGVHVCTLLAALPADAALPAVKLAEYHGVPSAYLAKHLQALAGAGVLETVKGARGGYRLARPPRPRSRVLDVVEAIDGEESAFRCTEIRRRGPDGAPREASTRGRAASTGSFTRADEAWREELAATTIASLVIGVVQRRARAPRWKRGPLAQARQSEPQPAG